MPRSKHEQPGYVLILRELERRDLDWRAAVALTGHHRHTCREYLAIAHSRGDAHIVDWRQANQRGRWYPLYRVGKGPDKPKPGLEQRHARRRLKRRVDTHGIGVLLR